MPVLDPKLIEFLRKLKCRYPEAKIVLFTDSEDEKKRIETLVSDIPPKHS